MHLDHKGNVLARTECGILFAPSKELRYKPDRLVHEPAQVRCRTCYQDAKLES
jgi:hypothetical protein